MTPSNNKDDIGELEQFDGFTPGPWWACCTDPGGGAHFVFAGEDGGPAVAKPLSNDPNHGEYERFEETLTMDERRANAKLIAAAPSLLAEVKRQRTRWATIDAMFKKYVHELRYSSAMPDPVAGHALKRFMDAWEKTQEEFEK